MLERLGLSVATASTGDDELARAMALGRAAVAMAQATKASQ